MAKIISVDASPDSTVSEKFPHIWSNFISGHHLCSKFFTLIELLIVIAVIAILAGILIPALSKTRKKAQSIFCVGNLRQIGAMMNGYTTDYQGFFPALTMCEASNDYSIAWMDVLLPYLGTSIRKVYHQGGIFSCPRQINFNNSWKVYISYGINSDFVGKRNYTTRDWIAYKGGRKISQVKQPSQHLIVTETWYGFGSGTADDGTGRLVPVRTLGNYDGSQSWIAFRHEKRSNTLYIDGHIASEGQDWLYLSHPLWLPWNIGNQNTTFLKYPGRGDWMSEKGYQPYD